VFRFGLIGFVFRFTESVRSVNEGVWWFWVVLVQTTMHTSHIDTSTHPPGHIDTSTHPPGFTKLVIRFGSRIADCRKELVVRFGADCVGNARGAVLMGNMRQKKPRGNLKIGILLVTGTGSPWEHMHHEIWMGKH